MKYNNSDLEYLKKYIDVNTQLIKILPSNLVHKANLAIFYALHLLKKEEAAKIWTEILPKTNPEQHPDMFFNFACFSCSYEDFENYEKYGITLKYEEGSDFGYSVNDFEKKITQMINEL